MSSGIIENRNPVLRLCSVKNPTKAQSENWVFSIARKRCTETQFSLFPIYCRLPKLDVAGSTPVSRSIFSITWANPETFFTHFTPLSGKNAVFELLRRLGTLLDARLRIDINRHADTVSALIRRHFRVDPQLVAEAGMRFCASPESWPSPTLSSPVWPSCADTRRYPATSG